LIRGWGGDRKGWIDQEREEKRTRERAKDKEEIKERKGKEKKI